MLVCILSNRPAAVDRYRTALSERGVDEVESASDVFGLFDLLTSRPISGLALDIPAIVRASEQGKVLLNSISEIYPLVKLNWAPGKEIRASGNHFLSVSEPPLAAFVLACRNYEPRIWRKYERIAKVMNLWWNTENSAPHRGFTLDISAGGCFVCCLDPPSVGELVTLSYLQEPHTVKARVTWSLGWNEMERAPGFGCEYINP